MTGTNLSSDQNSPSAQSQDCRLRVWHSAAAIDVQGEFEYQCEQLLDPDERTRADRFRRTTTRNQHVVGRAMARRLLGVQGIDPVDIRFSHGEFGKPDVAAPVEARLPFNIAHTDGLVICGIADPTAEMVGVDVESLSRKHRPRSRNAILPSPKWLSFVASRANRNPGVFCESGHSKRPLSKPLGQVCTRRWTNSHLTRSIPNRRRSDFLIQIWTTDGSGSSFALSRARGMSLRLRSPQTPQVYASGSNGPRLNICWGGWENHA